MRDSSTASKEIAYTDAAKQRLEKLFADLRRDVEMELRERNSVPGDEKIEITGSDVDKLAGALRVAYRDESRIDFRRMVVNFYLALGVLMMISAAMYPMLREMLHEPIQMVLLLVGLGMTGASFLMRQIIGQRDALLTKSRRLLDRESGRNAT